MNERLVLTPQMRELSGRRADIATLLHQEGRALAISIPDDAIAAARHFRQTLDEFTVNGQIFVAHKATDRTHAIKRLIDEANTGVDVASLGELEQCLEYGIDPKQMIVTGPKSDDLLQKAIEVGVKAIVVDSFGELERLIATKASTYPDVLLRLSRTITNRPGVKKIGRFGLDKKAYNQALVILKQCPLVRLRGLAFHIDSQVIEEKIHAIKEALELMGELPQKGFYDATVLDIGGGYGSAYGVTPEVVQAFDAECRRMVADGTINTWQKQSFGIKKSQAGQVIGSYSGIEMPVFPVGADRLRAILETDIDATCKIADRLQELLIEVWCEPGSAIFADAGIVASKVIDVCERDGNYAVVTNLYFGQVMFDGNEVMVDPILLPSRRNVQLTQAYVFGHLCMERDILSSRLLSFSHLPHSGDVLLWPYAGAYRMHMSQANPIMHPDMARYRYENGQFIKEKKHDL